MTPASFSDPYEDTLKSMRTGGSGSAAGFFSNFSSSGRPTTGSKPQTGAGNDSSSSFQDYLPWGRPRDENTSSSFISWPSWSQSSSNRTNSYFETFGLSMMQRYAAFAFCLLGAALLFFLALMHIATVLLFPAKFAMPFCMSTALVIVSFVFLHGFVSYARHLFSPGRWPFSSALILSTILTMVIAFKRYSYLLTIAMAIVQFAALIAFFVSYLPGGTNGVRMFGSMAGSTLRSQLTGF